MINDKTVEDKMKNETKQKLPKYFVDCVVDGMHDVITW